MNLNTNPLLTSIPHEVACETSFPCNHLLSRQTRQKIVSRCSHTLYRWYLDRSQRNRNWNPDTSFEWRKLRSVQSTELTSVIEGFYAVEQYAPDYTSELTRGARRGYGQSQFQIRWGAEEEKHADLWRNVLLFGGSRTSEQLEDYTNELRASSWTAPFETIPEMLFYTVLQERATQLIYLRIGKVARGELLLNGQNLHDPVLEKAVSAIAIDEAAHFDFYLSLMRLHLYYFPDESLAAIVNVIRNFVMPASKIVPNYDEFTRTLFSANLFGPYMYGREVARPALAKLGITAIKEVENAIGRTKVAPSLDDYANTTPHPGCDFSVLESSLSYLFDRLRRYEHRVGVSSV